MKKTLLLSAALIAALAGPALAQRDGRGDGGRGDGPRQAQGQQFGNGQSRGYGQRQATPQAAPQVQQQAPQQQAQRGGPDNRRDFDRGRDNDRRDFGRNNDGRRDFGRNDRFDNNRGGWNNRPGYDNRRYSNYYRNWNSTQRFRAGTYYRPNGFYYRRWTYGDILPSLFWSNRYWLSNYYAYDLPPPPPGTVWVRYGDDALLIDRYTGEIIQVSYSVFW